MKIPADPLSDLLYAFAQAFPDVSVKGRLSEVYTKSHTAEQRAEAARVAAHLMVCELMKHFTVRNLAAEQPAFNDLRKLLMEWHSYLKSNPLYANEAGWNTVKSVGKRPEGLSEYDQRIWNVALLLCINAPLAKGPEVLALLPDIIGTRDPLFPKNMADTAVIFFVEALEAQQAATA